MPHTIWIPCASPDAADLFCQNLRYLLNCVNPAHHPLAFVCIGSANVPGDALGPLIGTILTRHQIPNVYGTMDAPLNALTLPEQMPLLTALANHCCLIAIDAAIGNPAQRGCITLSKGALCPGSAHRKNLPPVGDLAITGVFEHFFAPDSQTLTATFCQEIAPALIRMA